jgi:hypothetical protein
MGLSDGDNEYAGCSVVSLNICFCITSEHVMRYVITCYVLRQNMLRVTSIHVMCYVSTCYVLRQNMLCVTTVHVICYVSTCYVLRQYMLCVTSEHVMCYFSTCYVLLQYMLCVTSEYVMCYVSTCYVLRQNMFHSGSVIRDVFVFDILHGHLFGFPILQWRNSVRLVKNCVIVWVIV